MYTYEQKYKEALERARKYMNTDCPNQLFYVKGAIENIFPELAESEDEKIRKDIKRAISVALDYSYFDKETADDCLAWLEKQGDFTTPQVYETENGEVITYSETDGYKVADPKFKIGDWIVANYGKVSQIVSVYRDGDGYILDDGTYIKGSWCDMYHLWTIQDAKDGDVLVYHNTATEIIMLFKSWVVEREAAYTHFHIFDNDFRVNNSCDCGYGAHPATKEQRDTLMKAMADEGWEFDFEKKELKKIEDEEYNGEDYGIDGLYHAQRILEKTLGGVVGYQTDDGILEHKCAITAVKKLYEQKSDWSEEDEKMFDEVINNLHKYIFKSDNTYSYIDCDKHITWLKSFKQRIGE